MPPLCGSWVYSKHYGIAKVQESVTIPSIELFQLLVDIVFGRGWSWKEQSKKYNIQARASRYFTLRYGNSNTSFTLRADFPFEAKVTINLRQTVKMMIYF